MTLNGKVKSLGNSVFCLDCSITLLQAACICSIVREMEGDRNIPGAVLKILTFCP